MYFRHFGIRCMCEIISLRIQPPLRAPAACRYSQAMKLCDCELLLSTLIGAHKLQLPCKRIRKTCTKCTIIYNRSVYVSLHLQTVGTTVTTLPEYHHLQEFLNFYPYHLQHLQKLPSDLGPFKALMKPLSFNFVCHAK